MEIPDAWLDELWTAALQTPKKPIKTRRQRILTKWRRMLTKFQRKALGDEWNAGQTLLIVLGDNQYGMGSSSRPGILHIIEREDDEGLWKCSCEAQGEFGTVAECRHIKRLKKIIDMIHPAEQVARLKRVMPQREGSNKVVSLSATLRRSAFG